MTNVDDQPEKGKIYQTSVTLKVPPVEPHAEFLQRRVNTKMTFCGDVDQVTSEGAVTKLLLATGHLTILLDETVIQTLPFTPETLLNKNVCITGYLTSIDKSFQITLESADRIFFSGH